MDATYNWPAVRHILFRAGPGNSASSIKDVAQAGAADTTRIGGASRARNASEYSGGFSSVWTIERC